MDTTGNTRSRYGAASIFFHWLMVVLIVAVYAAMDLKSLTPKGSAGRANMATWHYLLGLSVFLIVWLRLAASWIGVTPAIDPPPPAWQDRLAGLVHVLLYAFMIVMPLLGWLTVSAKGESVGLLGFTLPPLTAKNDAFAKTVKDVHESLATVGYFIIGLHALAALFHHYVVRDNTLLRMWPRNPMPVSRRWG